MTLTLQDIAALYEIGDGDDDLPLETVEHLREWVRCDAQFHSQVQTLRRLADVAGLPEDDAYRFGGALEIQAQLDRLLEAPSWDHPAEVLDPDAELGLECKALLKIAESRSASDDRIASALPKLQEAAEQERANRRTVQLFVEDLLEQPASTAQRMLRDAALTLEGARTGKGLDSGA